MVLYQSLSIETVAGKKLAVDHWNFFSWSGCFFGSILEDKPSTDETFSRLTGFIENGTLDPSCHGLFRAASCVSCGSARCWNQPRCKDANDCFLALSLQWRSMIGFAILTCAFPGHWTTAVSFFVICCILPFLTSDISGLWHLQAFLDYLLRRGGSGPVATTRWPTHRHSSWLWYWAWCRRSSQEIRCKQLFAYDMILFRCQEMFLTCFGMLLVVLQVFIDASYHWFVKDIAFQYTVNCFLA